MKPAFWCLLLIMVAIGSIAAQTIKVPENWDKLAAKASNVVNVNLDKKSLGLASRFMDDPDDAQAKRLISHLNGISVRILEFKNSGEFSDADVEPIRAQLQGPEWTHIVDINDKEAKESVQVYLKSTNGGPAGMIVLVDEPTELTFVNLDGPMSMDDLAALDGNFGVPAGLDKAAHGNSSSAKTKQSPDTKK